MTALELLAPAGNKTLGMAAIDHGADAVYIGAERFGARAAAGNPVKEISRLCDYAHGFRARVYVALNTLLFDSELEAARELIFQLWDAGADALIIQDMGLLELDLPPIPLFASTQTDNQTPEKVKFLEESGFERVILARELGLSAMAAIRDVTRVDLEAFVHGALCVCYSGQCYMSAAIGGRSANRGTCGQPCRLPWNLLTQEGKVLARNRHLLSLKDLDRSGHLGALARAGITSFKIEGRLKDLAYVKNITAFYRQRLDQLIQGDNPYKKASSGQVRFFFVPDPAKTFNRGTTDYFLTDPGPGPVHSMDTPKSMGEPLGRADQIAEGWFTLKIDPGRPDPEIRNGDGLCFVDPRGRLQGFRVNRRDDGGKIHPREPMARIPLEKGMRLFRNHNQAFARLMDSKTAERRIRLSLALSETPDGIALDGWDEEGCQARVEQPMAKETARNPEQALAAAARQLGRLGETCFYLASLAMETRPLFIQTGVLNQVRRNLILALEQERARAYLRKPAIPRPEPRPYPGTTLDFRANVANRAAEAFYRKRGVGQMAPAFELSRPPQARVMTTRHCIRHALGHCPVHAPEKALDWQGPLYLENGQSRFEVTFDCSACQMQIWSIL